MAKRPHTRKNPRRRPSSPPSFPCLAIIGVMIAQESRTSLVGRCTANYLSHWFESMFFSFASDFRISHFSKCYSIGIQGLGKQRDHSGISILSLLSQGVAGGSSQRAELSLLPVRPWAPGSSPCSSAGGFLGSGYSGPGQPLELPHRECCHRHSGAACQSLGGLFGGRS